MVGNAIDTSLKLQRSFWYVVMAGVVACIGYLLAANFFFLLLFVFGIAWLLLLPYHTRISVYVAVVTFSSALILPFVPGRPYWWEFAALLGWSGLVVSISLRKYPREAGQIIRSNIWLFVGVIGYCLVLVVTMRYRGFGFRILGSGQMGGRYYFQQLSCAIFPLTFLLCPMSEKTVRRLFVCQCLLTTTYVISDFVFAIAPKQLFFVLQFFELPNDAVSYERQFLEFGIRRWQSLYFVSFGVFLLLLVRFRIRDYFGRKGLWLIPLTVGILGTGLLGGARYLPVLAGMTSLFCMYGQRFFSLRNTTVLAILLAAVLAPTYFFATDLPESAQRAISFLPGIRVDTVAKADADATMETRRLLRKAGMEIAPRYFWIGRGFGQSAAGDYSLQWDPTGITLHLNVGQFYNGFIGLLVNTGFFGTVFMLLFLLAGTHIAWRVMNRVRVLGDGDSFLRLCCVVAALWMTQVIAFLFMHGDAEVAMKSVSLHSGLLLVCDNLLKHRLEGTNATS